MTSPTYPVWEGDGGAVAPARPTVESMGGRLFLQGIEFPPHDRRRLHASSWSQSVISLERLCRMLPVASIDFQCSSLAGGGLILNVSSVADGVTATTVSIASPVYAYLYTIYWPDGAFQSMDLYPRVSNASEAVLPFGAHVVSIASDRCAISCYDNAGTQNVDANYVFNLSLYGV